MLTFAGAQLALAGEFYFYKARDSNSYETKAAGDAFCSSVFPETHYCTFQEFGDGSAWLFGGTWGNVGTRALQWDLTETLGCSYNPGICSVHIPGACENSYCYGEALYCCDNPKTYYKARDGNAYYDKASGDAFCSSVFPGTHYCSFQEFGDGTHWVYGGSYGNVGTRAWMWDSTGTMSCAGHPGTCSVHLIGACENYYCTQEALYCCES
jgi:hypothetical protein